MGRITEISDTVSVEVRRESAAFMIDGAVADQDPLAARIEFPYRRVFALKAAVETIIQSQRFQTWLAKEERKS